jgi:hypothetical protein
MHARARDAGSWVLAALAGLALTVSLTLAYADRAVFSADGFADRSAATLERPAVRAAVARHVADAAIQAKPDLVAVRPLVEAAAGGLIDTEAFRSLLRAAARDLHRSAFDRDAATVTLKVADTGVLLVDALQRLRPELASRIPPGLQTRLAAASGGDRAAALRAVQRMHAVRRGAWVALAVAVLLALGAVAVAPSRRVAARRLGWGVAVCAGLLALVTIVAPRIAGLGVGPEDDAAVRAVLRTWLDPLAAYALALCAGGVVIVVAAASVVRANPVLPAVRRALTVAVTPPAETWRRAGWAATAVALGLLAVFAPRATLEAAVVAAGAIVALAGVTELLRLAAAPAPPAAASEEGAPPRGPRGLRRPAAPALRVAGVVALLLATLAVAGVVTARDAPEAPTVGRCNGHRALCDRRVDTVAFAATHNSMSADREPGWLFPAQDDGIAAQLQDGVRALLIDTHYGFATDRGVATDLSSPTKSRRKIEDELGADFVATAERLRTRIGYRGGGTRRVFLCHGFCEVGATDAVEALTAVHRFLVTHPEEVLVLSIEDDTQAADTEAAIRESGLIREVYRGAAKPPWPTLREMIERDERVLVLAENHGDDATWLHRQPTVAQETPYAFPTPQALAAPASCAPNRGGTAGSLLLVNHWVDTSPAPRKANARTVNATTFLTGRLDRCRERRHLLPNLVAVDFYRQGDVLKVVDRLNGV